MADTKLFQQERTYRRGVHQALDAAYAMASGAETLEDAVAILGAAVDAAQSLRNQADMSVPDERFALLDVIRDRAYAKARENS